ncbi:MAG: hypothetical protein ABUK01_15210 [Leptospirales bacterium]
MESMSPLSLFRKNITINQIENKPEGIRELMSAGQQFIEKDLHFEAGYAYKTAMDGSWGLDRDLLVENASLAVDNFSLYIRSQQNIDAKYLLTLYCLISTFNTMSQLFRNPSIDLQLSLLYEDLANKLANKENNFKDNYCLVYGISVKFNLDDQCDIVYDRVNYSAGKTNWALDGSFIQTDIPSAFSILKSIPDYEGTTQIIDEHPGAFDNNDLIGWKNVILAHNNPEKADEYFKNAYELFENDNPQLFEIEKEKGIRNNYSGDNHLLYSRYFKSRYYLSRALLGKGEFSENIISAIEPIKDYRSGFVSSQYLKYRAILLTFANFIDTSIGFEPVTGIEEFRLACKLSSNKDEDYLVLNILNSLSEYFKNLETSPERTVITSDLTRILDLLDSISYVDSQILSNFQPYIGQHVIKVITGGTNWIYRTIDKINDEAILRKVLLRLFQYKYPKYAQIVHGPMEHGKDILVVLEEQGINTLLSYQVKIGDIKTSAWRDIKPQLEEVFEVEPPAIITDDTVIHDKIGILIFNGHPNTAAEEKMSGWKHERFEKLGNKYEFMHLDSIVQFIVQNKLYSELRKTLQEFQIDLIQ